MTFQQYPFKGGIPSGTTAQRPGSPVIGDTYYNGELGLLEIYTSAGWQPNSAPSGTPTIVVTDLGTSRAYTDGPAFKIDFTASALGGFPVGYTVTATTTVTSNVYTGITSTGTTITVATFSGATGYGASYTVNGASYNGFGASPYQNGGVTVTTKPQAPTIGTASTSSTTSDILVTWTNGANGGLPLSSIKVKAYSGATLISTTTAATTSSTSANVTGLTTATNYTFKVFATSANGDSPESAATNSVTVPNVYTVDYVIVAGGGGGSSIISGGGGAGGVRYGSVGRPAGTTYTITVGAGGRGAFGYSGTGESESGFPGFDSAAFNISATGGGGANGWAGVPSSTPSGQRAFTRNGGSGGGSSANSGINGYGTGNLGGYSPVEGYAGGPSDGDAANGGLGGGGGGATEAGVVSVSSTNQRSGGNGYTTTISGSSATYGGGGGAGRRLAVSNGPSLGGSGGGGNSMTGSSFSSAQNGGTNTGGGGGGGNYSGPGYQDQAGGNGGSGVVIFKIPNTYSATFSGGVTHSVSTSVSGYKVYTVTAAGTSDTVTVS
jgi:hypothetical protein